ncbi:anti-sigma factor domain-containing protein [Neobacillus sp.]|uniref:anti-sigma factor domain-containing protein n=1 Tax=Neobacillus sp. TaxID=2675273 RepID=UPI002898C7C2|nr:anti-sigma factor domain-containing protein [Neobacillus sp.]
MKTGIIMEIDDVFLTLLTPEGEFLRANRQNQPYALGEEIHFFPIESGKPFKAIDIFKNIFKLKTVWAVMAAIIIFLSTSVPIYQNNKAYAYMSIDINPSIELGVNKKMQVIELNGYNKAGKQVISQLKNWNKKDVLDLTKVILAEMKNAGYINNNEHVIISTVRTKKPEENVEKELQKNIDKIKATVDSQHLELTVITATEKELDKAHQLGITAGKYQEKKIQSAKLEKNKEKEKTFENKNNHVEKEVPSDHSKAIPPGQLKKQQENNSIQNEKKAETDGSGDRNRWGGNSMPPGQLKKMEEEKIKQFYQKENFNENQKFKNNERDIEENYGKRNGNDNGKHNGNDNKKYNNNGNNNNNGKSNENNNGKSNGNNNGKQKYKN